MELNVNRGCSIIVADPLQLRRAGLSAFLQQWAEDIGISTLPVDPVDLPDELGNEQYRMIVVNVGGIPLEQQEPSAWIEALRQAVPDAPLVIMSDREDAGDIITAFRLGVRGYIPTSTSPAVALQALTFILNGGQFFPPAALLQGGWRSSQPMAASSRERKAGEGAESENGLTARQFEVLKLLRLGRPNKVIARELNMCEATVKVHVRQIMRRLGASNRTQAALMSTTLMGDPDPHNDPYAQDEDPGPTREIINANGLTAPAFMHARLTTHPAPRG